MKETNFVYINIDEDGGRTVTLDGDFTIEELEKIIRDMRECQERLIND